MTNAEKYGELYDRVHQHVVDAVTQGDVDYWATHSMNLYNMIYDWPTRYKVINGTAYQLGE